MVDRIPVMEKALQHAAARTKVEIEALIIMISVVLCQQVRVRGRDTFDVTSKERRDHGKWQEVCTESTLRPRQLYDHK